MSYFQIYKLLLIETTESTEQKGELDQNTSTAGNINKLYMQTLQSERNISLIVILKYVLYYPVIFLKKGKTESRTNEKQASI